MDLPDYAATMITAGTVDVTNCDREQVQFSGAVQPHGALVVLSEAEHRIVQASANTDSLLGAPAADALLGHGLELVLGEDQARAVLARLAPDAGLALDFGPLHVLRAKLPKGMFDVFAHRVGANMVIEFETFAGPSIDSPQLLSMNTAVRAAIAKIETTPSLEEFFSLACSEIRSFTGYDRVMAYKFLEDGSGDIVAESVAEGVAPYLGLRYPASDIPAPARRLFAMSWLRHLPDADYEPVDLVPTEDPKTGMPLDMSRSLLRSVSVMYSGYLKNMGVRSSLVMPLMEEGRLWGLIVTNHCTPRHIPYETRMAAEFLSHMLSLMMAAKERAETYEYKLRIATTIDHLVNAMANDEIFHHGLTKHDLNLLDCVESGGAALAYEGDVVLLGQTPTRDQVKAIVAWLDSQKDSGTAFATDHLASHWPEAAAFDAVASGLLAVRLVAQRPDYVLWFRPYVMQTVNWAGNPEKPVEVSEIDGEIRLTPRASFALYTQSVQGHSAPWKGIEVAAAVDLRRAIVEVILRHVEKMERANTELIQSNLELDSFAYVASHDLKEPLRGISNYTSLLLRSHASRLDEEARSRLDVVLRLTRRMDDLIESLLYYSRVGRVELAFSEVDLDKVLDDVLAGLELRIEKRRTEIRRPRSLPIVRCDGVRISEVFANLISNALKYNDKTADRWVEISWDAAPGGSPIFYVRDNGIGIADGHQERVFQIFKRLHGHTEYGAGAGVGLTIVRKMIDRHNGRIWIESIPGEGTTFRFTLAAG